MNLLKKSARKHSRSRGCVCEVGILKLLGLLFSRGLCNLNDFDMERLLTILKLPYRSAEEKLERQKRKIVDYKAGLSKVKIGARIDLLAVFGWISTLKVLPYGILKTVTPPANARNKPRIFSDRRKIN